MSKGRAFIGKLPDKPGKLTSRTARAGECLIDCPVCGTRVSTKQQQTRIRNHRSGTRLNNSWPCPGSGMAVHNEEGTT